MAVSPVRQAFARAQLAAPSRPTFVGETNASGGTVAGEYAIAGGYLLAAAGVAAAGGAVLGLAAAGLTGLVTREPHYGRGALIGAGLGAAVIAAPIVVGKIKQGMA